MWNNESNSFRKDEDTNLTCIPTLLRWKYGKSSQEKLLEEDELLNENYLEWFFYVQEDFMVQKMSKKVERYQVTYYDEFRNLVKNLNRKDRKLFFYFYGEKFENVR